LNFELSRCGKLVYSAKPNDEWCIEWIDTIDFQTFLYFFSKERLRERL